MKKILFFVLLVFCFSVTKSQCSLIYGVTGTGYPWSVISVDRYTGAYSILDTISSMQNLVSGTETIETDSDRYVTFGLDTSIANNLRIYTVDLRTGRVLYQPICDSILTDVHYDAKRKKIFALLQRGSYPSYQLWLVTVNPYNGSFNAIDSITGMRDVVEETSTLGIDSGRYYVMGLDSSSIEWLYALDETTGHIKYKKRDSNVYECQYDTISKNIYCISDSEDMYYTYKLFFNTLNPVTGIVTVGDSIPYMREVVFETSAFAQDSLKYFVVGMDSANYQDFYTIKATTGNTLMRPMLGGGSLNYEGTEYMPCNCSNSFNEPICIATIDTATNKAEVIWGRTNSPPAGGYGYYYIYKDSTLGYELTHTQPLDSLSEYIDLLSDPSLGPVSYKLATYDSCGESSLSAPHTTIYLTTTSVINAFILNWTAYVGFTPSKYRIFRGPALNAMVQIDSVPPSVLTYTDSFPPLGSIYLVEAVNPSGTCIPTHAPHNGSSLLSGSFSNGFNTKLLGVNNIGSTVNKLNIYPNPSNGMFTLSYSLNAGGNVKTTLVNELGQIVYDKTEQRSSGNITEQLSLENLASGIYSLRMQTDNGIMVRKVAIVGNR